jgi:hypothetical protein
LNQPSIILSLVQLKRAHILQTAQYEFSLSKDKSDTHTLRQEMMILQLKLSAAEDDLIRRRAAAEAISNQMTLESSVNRSLTSENAILRGKVVGLQEKLNEIWKEACTQLAEREAAAAELRQQLQMDGDQSKNELVAAQSLNARLRDELALAERTAAAAQERANLAEQTLKHREVLASERAQMQAEMQHYSQDLAKMALQTGNSANSQLLAETQAALKAERKARSAAEARCVQLEKQVAKLENQVETKTRRVARLEEALTQNATATPAGARAVSAAMNAVGGILSQLDNNSPDSEMPPQRRKPSASLLGGGGGSKKKSGSADVKNNITKRGRKGLAPVREDEEEESDGGNDFNNDPSFGEEEEVKPKKKAKIGGSGVQKKSTAASAAENNEKMKEAAAKLDLKHVWGDAEEDDDLGENITTAAGGGVNKESMLPPPVGKLQSNPLAALNPATIASAANQMRIQTIPPLKPVTAHPLLGVSGFGGSKRKLLGVSNNTALAGNDHLPAELLVRKDSGFSMPKMKQ